VVRPLSKAVKVTTHGRIVTFSLTESGQYSIERPGTGGFEDEVLLLFANRPETNVPAPTDNDVIWLGPGIHQRSIELQSGQTLYLAPGAVLFGGIDIWNAENVRICGRGAVVYYGPNSRNLNTNCKPDRKWHPLMTHSVKGLSVEGITFINRCRTMTLCQWMTQDTVFSNIKVIAAIPENLQCDGMDWFDGGRTIVRDSFFRTADDCFACFSADEMAALVRYQRYLQESPRPQPRCGEVTDITIERCVLWPTVANIFRAGWNAFTTRNITMRDCNVIHFNSGFNSGQSLALYHALFRATGGTAESQRHYSNYVFENIRFEEPAALLGVNSPQVALRGFCFKDIQFLGRPNPSILRGEINDVRFENVRVGDHPATTAAELSLTLGAEARNVEIVPFKSP
jgi:hypothetical protein